VTDTHPRQTAGTRSASPDTTAVLGALYRLLLRNVATRGRVVAVGALSALSVFTAVAVHAGQPEDPARSALDFVNGNITTLVPIGVLVFGAATIGDLIDDGSVVYLWLRPIPTRLAVLAAWAATVTIALPLVGLPILLSAAIIEPDGSIIAATATSLAVGIAAYSAIFVTAGIRFKRALPWGLAYILIWEGFVASAGETAAKLAVRSYLRSILSNFTGVELKLASYPMGAAILVPLAVTVVALAYASWRLGRTDVA